DLLRVGCSSLGATRGVVVLREGSDLRVRVADGLDAPAPGSVIDDPRVDDALERQVTVASLGASAVGGEGWPQPLGAGSLVASPLWISGEVAGVVALVCD